jgi:uncharacterized protein YecE (DUF72 family)
VSVDQGHANAALRLGLPAWAFPAWQGPYFRRGMAPLAEYARVFSAVEGNTTFYRIPDADLVARWREAVAETEFRFCFKLPRSVTHERAADFDALDAFLRAIAPLNRHLGPLLVQFPAQIGPRALSRIEAVLERLPDDRRHALEVRHPAFFTEPERLEPLIERFGLARTTMDTRALYEGDLDHPEVRAARHEKPDVPVLDKVYNGLRFVRLVLHPSGEGNARWLDEWAQRVAGDLAAGRTAYVLIHCPNNLHCPPFARDFHQRLQQRAWTPIEPLPAWPSGLR